MERFFDILEWTFRLFIFLLFLSGAIIVGYVPAAFTEFLFTDIGLNAEVGFWLGFVPGMLFFLLKYRQFFGSAWENENNK